MRVCGRGHPGVACAQQPAAGAALQRVQQSMRHHVRHLARHAPWLSAFFQCSLMRWQSAWFLG